MLGVKHALIDRYIYTYIYLRNAGQYNQIKIKIQSQNLLFK